MLEPKIKDITERQFPEYEEPEYDDRHEEYEPEENDNG